MNTLPPEPLIINQWQCQLTIQGWRECRQYNVYIAVISSVYIGTRNHLNIHMIQPCGFHRWKYCICQLMHLCSIILDFNVWMMNDDSVHLCHHYIDNWLVSFAWKAPKDALHAISTFRLNKDIIDKKKGPWLCYTKVSNDACICVYERWHHMQDCF